jgi:Cdc6-like AAA superfamily ATPase
MDFPEKLTPKVNSRMGNKRLVFKPYGSAQI